MIYNNLKKTLAHSRCSVDGDYFYDTVCPLTACITPDISPVCLCIKIMEAFKYSFSERVCLNSETLFSTALLSGLWGMSCKSQ